jgi:hypothetical protein
VEEVSSPRVLLTPDQVAAINRLRDSFTPKEIERMKRKMREHQLWIARTAARIVREDRERQSPRYAQPRQTRPERATTIARRAPEKRATPTRGDPDSDDPDPDPFAQLFEEIGGGGYQLTLFGRGEA